MLVQGDWSTRGDALCAVGITGCDDMDGSPPRMRCSLSYRSYEEMMARMCAASLLPWVERIDCIIIPGK